MTNCEKLRCCGRDMDFVYAGPTGTTRFLCAECSRRVDLPKGACMDCAEVGEACTCYGEANA